MNNNVDFFIDIASEECDKYLIITKFINNVNETPNMRKKVFENFD